MEEIVLETCFNEKGEYLGKIVINKKELTPEFLKKIEEDVTDTMGWKKYHQTLKDNGIAITAMVINDDRVDP